ncbi:hypothetical protein NKI98_21555 [Mesorhizobium sp. M0222]|uniref:hypothetical protein n=1 Tax=Mesorhizobium sp. M0222 TaxID=2956921 RepID=UPI00333B77D6
MALFENTEAIQHGSQISGGGSDRRFNGTIALNLQCYFVDKNKNHPGKYPADDVPRFSSAEAKAISASTEKILGNAGKKTSLGLSIG